MHIWNDKSIDFCFLLFWRSYPAYICLRNTFWLCFFISVSHTSEIEIFSLVLVAILFKGLEKWNRSCMTELNKCESKVNLFMNCHWCGSLWFEKVDCAKRKKNQLLYFKFEHAIVKGNIKKNADKFVLRERIKVLISYRWVTVRVKWPSLIIVNSCQKRIY